MRSCSLMVFVLSFFAAPLLAQGTTPELVPYASPDAGVRGRMVDVRRSGKQAKPVKGELLAVSTDTLWVLEHDQVISVPLSGVTSASVQRHGMTAMKGLIWGVGVGVASGAGLMAACNSVSEDCGSVMTGAAIGGVIVGGLSAISLSESSRVQFKPAIPDSLARFARFPQGMPPGVVELLGHPGTGP